MSLNGCGTEVPCRSDYGPNCRSELISALPAGDAALAQNAQATALFTNRPKAQTADSADAFATVDHQRLAGHEG